MKFISKIIIITGVACLFSTVTGHARTNDSVVYPVDYSLLPIRHLWLQVENPVAYASIGDAMDIRLRYNHTSGSYKHLSNPKSINGGKVSVEGFKQVGQLHFFGDFSYGISTLNGQKWNNVLMPSPGNPYLLADSIGGNYNNELFDIRGGVASSVKDRLTWGIAATYKGGSSSDENDPRTLIDAVRYSLRPGILYRFSRWSLGADIGMEGYAEKIGMDSYYGTSNFVFFQFQGLGNYFPDSGNSHSRRYKGKVLGGNIQLGWEGRGMENILQLGYRNNVEKSEDGSTFAPFKSGDYKENRFSISNLFSLKRNDITQIAKLSFDYIPSKGIWYDQQRVTNVNNQTVWEVFNQSVQYRNRVYHAAADYGLTKEREGFAAYAFGGTVIFEQQNSSFLPEMYLQQYSNITIALKGEKTLRLPKMFLLGLKVNAGYRKNLSSKADFEGITLAGIWSYPVLEYLTSDYYTGGVQAKLNKRTLFGKLPTTVYLTAGIDYTKSTLKTTNFTEPHRINVSTAFGCTF
ncbi:DUF6850 family outer membrane beta-barrel protein [Proteiniphilum acetatigenes]|uniref:DUF6850 family outer membrane beta-barrel protein n=1 Tax=Proteiniphilum acetatigenes TaxID=294710 RepID=UPI0003753C72|nr:DUF6850 family outer membrane beta-barrel protein [Proteiniphilum acetatigenes]